MGVREREEGVVRGVWGMMGMGKEGGGGEKSICVL